MSVRAGVSVRVRIRNRVRGRVKLTNYSLVIALPVATSADLHIHFLLVSNSIHHV